MVSSVDKGAALFKWAEVGHHPPLKQWLCFSVTSVSRVGTSYRVQLRQRPPLKQTEEQIINTKTNYALTELIIRNANRLNLRLVF